MRSAPVSNLLAGLGAMALLAGVLSACGSSNNTRPDASIDAGDAGPDTASDVRADVRRDVLPDLIPPPPTDVGNPLCEGVSPTTNYSDPFMVANFDGFNDRTFSEFGSGSPISGGVYPGAGDPIVVTDFSGQNLHVTATVGVDTEAHFGIYWLCALPTTSGGCTLDVSRFKGIRFKVKGNAGPDNAMRLSLGRAENDPQPANAGCGSCVVPTDSDAATGDYCQGPVVDFPVPGDGSEKTVTLLWTDFVGGSPHPSIDPHQVTGILWRFHRFPAGADGGTGGSDAAATDGPVDAPSDADLDATSDAADAGSPEADADAGGPEAGDDAGSAPGYAADITIDDIELVPF